MVRSTIELLASILSIVCDFIGAIVLALLAQWHWGQPMHSIPAGAMILMTLILPTVVNISIDILLAVR